jgi:hypothetical protein
LICGRDRPIRKEERLLTRKRAVIVALAASALIAGGAGAAFAATRGSAASKPSVVTPKRHTVPRAHHNCPNMGAMYRPSSPAM